MYKQKKVDYISVVKSMFFSYVSVVFVFIVAVIFISNIFLGATIEASEKNDRVQRLEQANTQIEGLFDKIQNNVISTCSLNDVYDYITNNYQNDALRRKSIMSLQEMLINFKNYNTMIDSIALYSAETGYVLSDKTYIRIESEYHLDILKKYKNVAQKPKWTFMTQFGNREEYCFAYVREVPFSATNKKQGLIVIEIKEDFVIDNINSYIKDDNLRNLFITDSEGRIISAFDKKMINENVGYEFDTKSSGAVNVKYLDKKHVMLHAASPYLGWSIVSFVPAREISKVRMINSFIIMIVLLGVTIITAFILARINRKMHFRMRKSLDEFEKKIKKKVGKAKKYVLIDVLTKKHINAEEAENYRDLLEIDARSEYFAVLLVKFNDGLAITGEIMENIDGVIDLSVTGMSAILDSEVVACMFYFCVDEEHEAVTKCQQMLEYLNAMLKYEFKRNVTVSYGNVYKGFENINLSYEQAAKGVKYKLTKDSSVGDGDKIMNEMVKAIVAYVDENYCDPDMSLNMLSNKFELSVSYLSRVFRMYQGKSFVEYVTEKRVEKAKELLENNEMKINEIGEQVGYINYVSFLRAFKKNTGVNPGDYRTQNQA